MRKDRLAGKCGMILLCNSLLFACCVAVTAQRTDKPIGGRQRTDQQSGQNREGGRSGVFQTNVPAHSWDIVAGRPTLTSICLSILAYKDLTGYIAYGQEKGRYPLETPKRSFTSGQPIEILLSGLKPDTRYFYRFRLRTAGNEQFESGPELTFVTARPAGANFTFAIQADSHLDEGVDPDTYKRSLTNIADSGADFLVDLGDTFMTDKYSEYRDAEAQYLAQRYYFGIASRSIPLFLTLGNHDGEAGWRRGGGDNIFNWSNTNRKKYFPDPIPDEFYGGNKSQDPQIGFLQNYFSWQWGDALFVVLDPFTYTTSRSRGDDNWGWTLGKDQYSWLKQTLEASKAKYKFIFIHHLVGGGDRVARGGAEAAPFFEWGGKSLDGKDEFAARRPGWAMPIHKLLVQNGVSAVFHGHDHLYVKQDLDGIVYQEVPQPGHSRVDNTRSAGEYGYKEGVLRGSSGVLIVKVMGQSAKVSYVRAFPENREGAGRKSGTVDHEYEIAARPR